MIEFITDLAEYGFLQRALIAGVIVGISCSLLSSFVVLKKMAFIGHGISHGAFGGVALGLMLGVNYNITAFLFTLLVAFLIWLFSRKRKVSEDSAIGILLVSSMALGILFLGSRTDVFGYLFGSILSVSVTDIWVIAITGLVILLVVLFFFKEILFFLFDPDSAAVAGLRVDIYQLLLLTLLSLTIVISIKVVGIILVSSYLIITGATAALLTNDLKKMIFFSVLIGVTASVTGLVLSNSYNVPSGAGIVLSMVVFFLVVLGITHIIKRKRKVTAA